MLRTESPVKARISALALETPNVTFSACGNTQVNMSRAEGTPVTLLSEAKVTPSGVVRLMELQKGLRLHPDVRRLLAAAGGSGRERAR
jgi:intracellular sulfur oxidation DsrE/DsrF family protein